jgi:integrase
MTRIRGIWTVDQLVNMWDACRGEWWEAAYLLSAFGGCRVGESLGPTARDVTRYESHGVVAAIVGIERQVSNAGGVVDELKNPQSHRAVVIPGPMGVRILEMAKESELSYLTGDGMGGSSSQRRLNAAWSEFCSRDDVETHPFRNLRNSWETYSRWVLCLPPWVTEKLLGHAGRDVTSRHYDRPEWEQFADAVTKAYSDHPFATKDDLGRKRDMQAV